MLGLVQRPPGKQQLLELAEEGRAALREASRRILEICAHKVPDAQQKADGSPLTEADLASHQLLDERLTSLSVSYPVLSEEGDDFSPPAPGTPFWLVDPLDGTRDFLAGTGEYTVNVALVSSGSVLWGGVAVPEQEAIYEGGIGLGSRLWRGSVPTMLSVAEASARQCRVLVSRSHSEPATEAAIEKLQRHFEQVSRLSLGSALKFCALAEGNADCYPRTGGLRQWDLAAGQAVLEGAGGQVLCLDSGCPPEYKPQAELVVPAFIAFGDARTDWRSLVAQGQ